MAASNDFGIRFRGMHQSNALASLQAPTNERRFVLDFLKEIIRSAQLLTQNEVLVFVCDTHSWNRFTDRSMGCACSLEADASIVPYAEKFAEQLFNNEDATVTRFPSSPIYLNQESLRSVLQLRRSPTHNRDLQRELSI